MQTHSTTPFGRRSLTLAMVASQASARDFASKAGRIRNPSSINGGCFGR